MNADILLRKQKSFVLWRITNTMVPPSLLIGELQNGTPVTLINQKSFPLLQDQVHNDLWYINADQCRLTDGKVYHYWFVVTDARSNNPGICITDPSAFTVNWSLLSPVPADYQYPAGVIKYENDMLVPCDAGGEELVATDEISLTEISPNNQIVIYELPAAWTRAGTTGGREIAVGTFNDVTALIDTNSGGSNFDDLEIVKKGRSYLTELGINALELLPPADSVFQRGWGYHTTNFFAPDYELGKPDAYTWSLANQDLRILINACHKYGLRFFLDTVMAFASYNPYTVAAPGDFFIFDPASLPTDPDAWDSEGNIRDGFGSDLFRYSSPRLSYDPVSGEGLSLYPARQLMKAALIRWMNDFRLDGIRIDSVTNIANWDFVGEYKNLAWQIWQGRFKNDSDHFLVIGEELAEPPSLLQQQRVDSIWHENFKKYMRFAICGQSADGEPGFESTVRKAIDCRNFGFSDLSQAVIYLTSHDVEGYRNERLYNFLQNNGVADTETRIKLAHVCLLTAVGIPMILAGEEFADQHDLFDQQGNVSDNGGKEVDPVDYSRLSDDWRTRIKNYVAILVRLRTESPALCVNDTNFIHVDFSEGKRVLAWQRGIPGSGNLIIVLANFSDYGTPNPSDPSAQYVVNNWPALPAGKTWQEVTQNRTVPASWAGKEPIYPWEAKVYQII
jgi:pullulanase